ncbi:hypothetical protein KTJ16_03335 [Acinetobacter bereziniae]|uniref:hypothetical protein n=1 Tax=Acinetobacter bereziniae TaxID=106648 RepID=UPI000EF6B285|nr:hypothetical protein [Acinetobacter bereziniae]MBJ8421442.1 hypothetical protein [Acinetobacter bereziniae]MCU4475614.1 hypothetical protein [Acinetobacter bereziniae]MCU4540208.1 hypothetical protein [Acinetobacter bereziniae]MCU4625170.1 hypothetical protein [Acinetobacter bereziniae]
MMKKIILLGVLGVSLTGCIVAPYDDDHRGGHGRYDHRDRDRDRDRWDHRHDRDRDRYDRDRNDRDWNWKTR